MLNSDIQAKLAVQILTALTQFEIDTEATNVSSAVDTQKFNGVLAILQGDRAIAADDDFVYKFEESDSGSGDWTDVVDNGHLPYRKNPDRTLVIEVSPFSQTVGVFSTKRYIRLSITGTADTTAFNLTPTFIKQSDLMEFNGYDPAVVPGDSLP